MCGVIAVIDVNERRAVELATLGMRTMAHRGTRSRLTPVHGGAIGHVRLPIVGLGEANDQPVFREFWTIAFVGEILDFHEWRPDLECDIDLVADMWEQSQASLFREHDGFWHVVAHDSISGELHVLTDYLAQKPCYIRADSLVTAVASEPNALAILGPTTPDEIYFSAVIKWGYCPEPWRTPYREIRKTFPGEHTVLYKDGSTSRSFPDVLQPIPTTPSMLKQEIEDAVRRRVMSSDVPVGALVSGGLDSAIVYTLARRHGNIKAYHAENRELDACLSVAPDATILDHRNVDQVQALDYMQEPLDLGSLFPQVALSDAIGDSMDVCLTGDGADELFGGYGRSFRYDSQASDVWHELIAWHMPRLDRVMMKNRIEIRSPFLARNVAGAALGLPRELRTGKRILRDMFRGDLPKGAADRLKRPLRTHEVENDRETWSLQLVDMFRKKVWG